MSRTRLLAVTAALCAGLVIAPVSANAADDRDGSRVERVVTLGDSYSSGSGIHRNATDYDDHGPEGHSFRPWTRLGASACQRELDETPGPRLAAELGAESIVVACAGAVVGEIPAQVRAADIPADGEGTVVSVTIGGNDVRTQRGESWPDALLRCITSIGCDRSSNELANLDDLRRELTDVYADIGERYPEISVRVLGYPRLMQSDRFCEGVAGMSRSEADFVDGQVDRLNAKIGSAVALARARTGADLRFVSVADEFDNHGACRFWQRDRYVNDAVFGDSLRRSRLADGTVRDHVDDSPLNVSSASFHPSSKGYDAYGRALTASIADLLDPDLR